MPRGAAPESLAVGPRARSATLRPMSRRKKIWLSVGFVLVGVPLLALVVGWCLIHSGWVER